MTFIVPKFWLCYFHNPTAGAHSRTVTGVFETSPNWLMLHVMQNILTRLAEKINKSKTCKYQRYSIVKMSGIGESRSELIAWVNGLLQLNYKKVEECGTGAAYCQIMDSIYNDVPMHRVKFDVSTEYEYYTNYKILQSSFARHQIEKIVYVEKMVRCRFQDNLEFLQWIKKYWTQHKDSNPYDPLQRRKYRAPSNGTQSNSSSGSTTPNNYNSITVNKRRTTSGYNSVHSNSTFSTNRANSTSMTSTYGRSVSNPRRVSNEQLLSVQNELSQAQVKITNLNNEIEQYKDSSNILEREREFYFGKLRDIEILVQSTQDLINEGFYKNETAELTKFLNRIQQILYATEEGYDDNVAINNDNSNNNIITNNNNTTTNNNDTNNLNDMNEINNNNNNNNDIMNQNNLPNLNNNNTNNNINTVGSLNFTSTTTTTDFNTNNMNHMNTNDTNTINSISSYGIQNATDGNDNININNGNDDSNNIASSNLIIDEETF